MARIITALPFPLVKESEKANGFPASRKHALTLKISAEDYRSAPGSEEWGVVDGGHIVAKHK